MLEGAGYLCNLRGGGGIRVPLLNHNNALCCVLQLHNTTDSLQCDLHMCDALRSSGPSGHFGSNPSRSAAI
jgi:hypothetical protein